MPRRAAYLEIGHQFGSSSKAYDQTRREVLPWRRFYKTARWQGVRLTQLAAEPLCAFCKATGKIVEAEIVDHVLPHRGDEVKFFAGPFQSLCKRCHDGAKQRIERAMFTASGV